MQATPFDTGIEIALTSLLGDRLAVLIGAGLSMAPPSNLPSAAALAFAAKQKYDATYGNSRPALADSIEAQAEFFFQRGELESVYFRTLIDQHAFSSQPNQGHYSIADLLLIKAITTAVTTNVDTLTEIAGALLYGKVEAVVDGQAAAALPLELPLLLKIHGCHQRDHGNMIWAPGQVGSNPVAGRIANSAAWLTQRLPNRDLLIVGYWTDWSYLNEVLANTLGTVAPARVIVVDPADAAVFSVKAPVLYALGERATVSFQHIQASGADFLDALRRKFSQTFVRRVLHSGKVDFEAHTGNPPQAEWLEPNIQDNSILWQIRRDMEGRLPDEPAKEKMPPPGETHLGLTLLQLLAAGAVSDDSYWLLNSKRIRVIRAANKFLHRVESEFERETPPAVAPDMIIAVGADNQHVPSNFARHESQPTIARGSKGHWFTRAEGLQELGL